MISKILIIARKFKTHFLMMSANFVGIIAVFTSFKLINLTSNESTLGLFSLIIVYKQIIAKVINFGLPTYALKQVSKNRDDYSREDINKFYSKTLGVICKNAGICILILVVAFFILGNLISDKFSTKDVVILGSMAPIYAVILYNSQMLRARKYFISFQLLNGSLTYGLFCVFLFIAYMFDIEVTNVPFLFLMCLLLVFVFSFFILKIKVNFKEVLNGAYLSISNHIGKLKDGLDFFVVQLSSQGLNWITLIYTSYFIGEIDTGGLNIILRLAVLCSFFKTIINSIKGPDYAYLYHAKEVKKLNSEIKYNTNLLVYFSLPFISILFIFPEFFLGLFSDDYGHLITVFRIVLIGALVDNLFGSVGLLMQMTKEEKNFKNLMVTTVFIHLIVGFLLTFYFKVQGLALSLLIAAMFWNLISSYLLKKRHSITSYYHL